MTDKPLAKFQDLLRELFQFDCADLDFGIYRILNHKRDVIRRFIEEDLPKSVEEALNRGQVADQARAAEKLEALAEQVRSTFGADALDAEGELAAAYRGTPLGRKYLEARQAARDARGAEAMAAEAFNHLYRFFSRYYEDGDFISKRRYSKEHRYAIPYNGEEVLLHWATADQYYVKSAEYFRDYQFQSRIGVTIRFELQDADVEHDNVKGARRFFIARAPEASWDGELRRFTVPFEYRPLTVSEKAQYGAKQTDTARSGILKQAADAIRKAAAVHPECVAALDERRAAGSADQTETLLEYHLRQYARRNTSDFFIHKDLSGFLTRELDFYVKNDVLSLDTLQAGGEERAEGWFQMMRLLRSVGGRIIAFLAQIEDFQKMLWEKRKFVVDTQYCVTLDRVPEHLYPEIGRNNAQRQEWESLYAISEISADRRNGLASPGPLGERFLGANPHLVLDTRHFDQDFKDHLLSGLSDTGSLDEAQDGLLIHGENFQALNLLQACYRGRVGCIYIDPPYNTGGGEFTYKDAYRHSSWVAMIYDRLQGGRQLATQDAAIFASIDQNEQIRLRAAFDATWGAENHVAEIVWAAGRKNDSKLISVSHEYIHVYVKNLADLECRGVKWRQRKKGLEDIYRQYRRLKKRHSDDYAAMTRDLKDWYRDLADSHPAKAHRHYCHVDARGIYFPDNISWPGGGGPSYEVLHPATRKPVAVPSRGWMTSDPNKMRRWIAEDRVHFGADESGVPSIKSYLRDREYQTPYSVFYKDGRGATKRLRDVLGMDDFGYPKDETVIADCVGMLTTTVTSLRTSLRDPEPLATPLSI